MRKPFCVMKKYLLLIVIAIISINAQNDFTSETISIKDGLSSNIIRDILQDEYGYLWISTNDGVNVYDGYNIKVYKNIVDDSTSLPSNSTLRIYEDREGTIWISTAEGIARFNRDKNNFTNYKFWTTELDNEFAHTAVQVFEDSKGYLWFNTAEGTLALNRESELFEGFDIIWADNSVKKFNSWGGEMLENENGEFFVLSLVFGLLKFDYNANMFIQVPLKNNGNDKIIGERQYAAIFDKNQNLWSGSSGGLLKINLNTYNVDDITPFNKIEAQNRWLDNAVGGLILDDDNNIWVGTGMHGIFKYSSTTQEFNQIPTSISANSYKAFIFDNSGILWYASSKGITKVDFNRKPLVTYSVAESNADNPRKEIIGFSKTYKYKNKVWLVSADGVYEFDQISHSLVKASSQNKDFARFDEGVARTLLEAKNGELWLGTVRDGLYSFNINSGKLRNYKNQAYDLNSIPENFIYTLAEDSEQNLWIGTFNGLSLLKNGDTKFTLIPSLVNRIYNEALMIKLRKMWVTQNPVTSIIKAGDYADLTKEFVLRDDAELLACSIGEGLSQVNMLDYGWLESESGDTIWTANNWNQSFHAGGHEKNRIQIGLLSLKAGRYKIRYTSDDSHSAASFNRLATKDSTYWGIQLFAVEDSEFEKYNSLLQSSLQQTYLRGEDINEICIGLNKDVWIGTQKGLSLIDSNFIITNYFNVSSDSYSLSSNRINDIKLDNSGNVWVVTDDGLNKLDRKENKFKIFRETDGLPSSRFNSIEIDNDGDLWLGGIKGISKIELDENGDIQSVVSYDVKDGLQGYEFLRNSSFKDETGKLYFGGSEGFNAFYPGSSNKTPPFVTLQDIKISNKSILEYDNLKAVNFNSSPEISLSHNQNDLSFEFASIHFSRPDKNKLMYKMDGIDEDWQNGYRRFASYTNMSPGEYVFNIKGSNGDGIWNKNIKSVTINISSPWYNNWIAYSIYFMFFLSFLYSIRKVEIKRQQKNAEIQESRFKIETAVAKAEAAEAKALIVQAENERKSKELEEARTLQLSMLPIDLPQIPNLDIAVYMKTATEVGGDYYDFHVGMDGVLTVVLGDATGHGMKAGTMVTAVKGLFNSYSSNPDILYSFHEISRCIKQMRLGKLSMCMTMLKINNNKMLMSAAGMPPIMIYKSDERNAQEVLIKGMPLGTFDKYPYDIRETELKTGDTIFLMSDGLPELQNNKGEQFGYQRIRNLFENNAGNKPEEIIEQLKLEGDQWSEDSDPDDDITFVVIKVK